MANLSELKSENAINLSEIKDFDQFIKSAWLEKKRYLWYPLDKLKSKELSGIHSIRLLLNQSRLTERRAPPLFTKIVEPFNENNFNFNRIRENEILSRVEFDEYKTKNVVTFALNVCPISTFHTLIIPNSLSCKPQVLDTHSLDVVLKISLMSRDSNLLILGNSILALATVNHLHYHLLYMDFLFPAMNAVGMPFISNCKLLTNYFAKGFLFEFSNSDELIAVKTQLSKIIKFFIVKSIAHNLSICKRSSDINKNLVLLFPRKSEINSQKLIEKNITSKAPFFVASSEFSGIITVLGKYYDSLTEEMCIDAIGSPQLSQDEFNTLLVQLNTVLL